MPFCVALPPAYGIDVCPALVHKLRRLGRHVLLPHQPPGRGQVVLHAGSVAYFDGQNPGCDHAIVGIIDDLGDDLGLYLGRPSAAGVIPEGINAPLLKAADPLPYAVGGTHEKFCRAAYVLTTYTDCVDCCYPEHDLGILFCL